MDKQELRNQLSRVEDDARKWRRARIGLGLQQDVDMAFTLIARLTQLVRENIVQ